MKTLEIAFWRHQPVVDQTAMGLAEATLAFHRDVGGDLVKLTPAGTYQAHAMGLQDRWENDPLGRRHITARPIRRPADWLTLGDADFGRQEINCLEAATWLADRLPPGLPLLATVFSPLSQALQLAGSDTLANHFNEAPAEVHYGLSCIANRTLRLSEAFRTCGVSGIYYVSQHHAQGVFPRLERGSDGLSSEQIALDMLRDLPLNIMHFHGAPLVKDLPVLPAGWRVHYECSDENPGLLEWSLTRPEPIMPGIPLQTLCQGRDMETRRSTLSQISGSLAADHLLLGAACVLPLDFPLDLAAAWVRSAKETRYEKA